MPTLPTLNVLHRAEFPSDYATVMVLIENVHGAQRWLASSRQCFALDK
jgi:hypothetical protein